MPQPRCHGLVAASQSLALHSLPHEWSRNYRRPLTSSTSTLPLLAAERIWWTDKVLLSFLGSQECREGQDLTQDVLWPVPLKGTLILPSLLRSRLLLVRALFTTLAVLVASLTLQLPVLYTVRVVVSSLTRGMVDTEVLTFLMPLLAVAVLYTAISTPAMALLRAVTVRETWRTHREYSRTLLARELGFKLCVWAGPALWPCSSSIQRAAARVTTAAARRRRRHHHAGAAQHRGGGPARAPALRAQASGSQAE